MQKGKPVCYEFNWGHFTERKKGNYIVWEFYLTELIDSQKSVFYELEKVTQFSTRDIYFILGMSEGWVIFPSHSEPAFHLISHFSSEDPTRIWIVNTLIRELVPKLIRTIKNNDETPRMLPE